MEDKVSVCSLAIGLVSDPTTGGADAGGSSGDSEEDVVAEIWEVEVELEV